MNVRPKRLLAPFLPWHKPKRQRVVSICIYIRTFTTEEAKDNLLLIVAFTFLRKHTIPRRTCI